MKTVDEAQIESDQLSRFQYLAEFIGFGEPDIAALHASAQHLAPLVPGLVDSVYDQLSKYDATWRHFVPRQSGFEGKLAETVETLGMDSETIQFRKNHLAGYLNRLVTAPYDETLVAYLNAVGSMHTPGMGNARINVPLVQMNALMGFVADAVIATITSLGLDRETEVSTLRAFNKVLWLQNDMINRHYAA